MEGRSKNPGTGLIKNRASLKRCTSEENDSEFFPTRSSWTHGVDLVFLVGCPRSGTTWLQSMLACHPSIYSGPETHFFVSFSRFEEKFKHPPALNVGPSAYLKESEFYKSIRELFWCLISKLPPPKRKPSYFIEGTPHHCDYAEFILRTFPDARFIHLIRDGRAVVASLLRISKTWGADWAPNTVKRATKMWQWRVRQGQKIIQLTQSSNQYIDVRYEDLRQNPQQYLPRLFEWLGLPIDESLIDLAVDSTCIKKVQTSNKAFPTIPKWNEKYPRDFFGPAPCNVNDIQLSHVQRLAVEYIAGDLLLKLGYPEVKTQFSDSEKKSILKEIETGKILRLK